MGKKLRLSVKGTICFVILFGVTVRVWWFFRSYFLFVALVLMAVCVPLSALTLWFAGNGLCVRVCLPAQRVGKNSEIPFSIQIDNPMKIMGFTADISYLWGNVFTDHFLEGKERMWIAPGRGAERLLKMQSVYAGRLEIKIQKFKVYDLFHIFCLCGCDTTDASMIAAPALSVSDKEEIHSCVEGFPKENETRKRGIDYNPDYEVREYIPGDELKNIHWKLTAKQNRMMVRERLASGREKINVVLPLEGDREQNDRLMDALYDLCRILLKKEYPIQLFWPGTDNSLRTRFLTEEGELEHAVHEILSSNGMALTGGIKEQMSFEHPGEHYILIRTGAYKGAYIQ